MVTFNRIMSWLTFDFQITRKRFPKAKNRFSFNQIVSKSVSIRLKIEWSIELLVTTGADDAKLITVFKNVNKNLSRKDDNSVLLLVYCVISQTLICYWRLLLMEMSFFVLFWIDFYYRERFFKPCTYFQRQEPANRLKNLLNIQNNPKKHFKLTSKFE